MKKFTNLSLPVEDVIIDGHSSISIFVSPSSLRDWCLYMQLLRDTLLEAFSIVCSGSSNKVEFTSGPTSRCDLNQRPKVSLVTLSMNDIDYASYFFLQYYRDGAAQVDHIDIDTNNGGYITFKVDEYMPPVSPEEAKRILGNE